MDKKYDIFISYSRKDAGVVMPFVYELEARDLKVWVDISNIDYGVTFPDHIAQALDESDSMLFMCTHNSVHNSPYCKKELGYARTNGLDITAILVDGYMPKKGWFALEYNDVNCVNISDKKQLHRLFETLENKYFPERVAERKAKIAAAREAAKKKVREEEEKRIIEEIENARRAELDKIEKSKVKKLHRGEMVYKGLKMKTLKIACISLLMIGLFIGVPICWNSYHVNIEIPQILSFNKTKSNPKRITNKSLSAQHSETQLCLEQNLKIVQWYDIKRLKEILYFLRTLKNIEQTSGYKGKHVFETKRRDVYAKLAVFRVTAEDQYNNTSDAKTKRENEEILTEIQILIRDVYAMR